MTRLQVRFNSQLKQIGPATVGFLVMGGNICVNFSLLVSIIIETSVQFNNLHSVISSEYHKITPSTLTGAETPFLFEGNIKVSY